MKTAGSFGASAKECYHNGTMHTIVGLGNPGEEYRMTRHNVGWRAVDAFIQDAHLPEPMRSGTFNALLSEGVCNGEEVGVLFPLTYMNGSGSSVLKYLKERKADPSQMIVVHDEVDLPLGTLRISVGRSGGGHNGVQSLIESLGSAEFTRVRIGIAKTGLFGGVKRPAGNRLSDFVLGTFTRTEEKVLPEVLERAADAVSLILEKGAAHAMNQYNS
jgi:PTH1 family peptidyl-tRNA hydrolase